MRIIALADDLTRLITLAMAIAQGLEELRSRMILGGSERTLSRKRWHEAYLSGNNKVTRDCDQDNNVPRLKEITLANDMARLREIALAMTML